MHAPNLRASIYPKGAYGPASPSLSPRAAGEGAARSALPPDLCRASEQEYRRGQRMREVERVITAARGRRVLDGPHRRHGRTCSQGIRLRAYGQTDPVVAYKREGFAMFDGMITAIREETVRRLYLFRLRRTEEDITPQAGGKDHRRPAALPIRPSSSQPVAKKIKVGRERSVPVRQRQEVQELLPRQGRGQVMSFRVHREGELEYLTSDALDGAAPLLFHPLRRGERGRARQPEPGHAPGRPAGKRAGELLPVSAGPLALRRRRPCSRSRCIPPSSSGSAARTAAAACSGRRSTACDGLVTNEPGVALTIFSADCTPVLLFDPNSTRHRRGPCGLARHGGGHCGPRGRGHAAGVRLPRRRTSARPSVLASARAALRRMPMCRMPCALRWAMRQSLLSRSAGKKFYVDLKQLNAIWLRRAGVTCIDVSADCTACQPQRFWSHRRVGNTRGSLAAIIRLREEG